MVNFYTGVIVKNEPGLIPGKKKRGRPKKIKTDEAPPPEMEKITNENGEIIIKKRRGRPKKIHQQQKLAEREAKEREQLAQLHHHQQQHPHMGHHMGGGHMDGYGNMPNCFSPPMMSPPKPFSHMAPYPQAMNEPGGYYGQHMADSPYNMATGNKQSPVHMQHYSQSPKSMSMSYTHSDLSSEINTAISSEGNNMGEPSPMTSPGGGMDQHPDFDNGGNMGQQQQQGSYNPACEHGSPGGPPSSGYSSYMSYHDQEQQQHPHQGTPTPMSQTTDEHSHHSHPTPPHNHPHTPTHSMSPHPHEQYGELFCMPNKLQKFFFFAVL